MSGDTAGTVAARELSEAAQRAASGARVLDAGGMAREAAAARALAHDLERLARAARAPR